jgi:hypothetical protein
MNDDIFFAFFPSEGSMGSQDTCHMDEEPTEQGIMVVNVIPSTIHR